MADAGPSNEGSGPSNQGELHNEWVYTINSAEKVAKNLWDNVQNA